MHLTVYEQAEIFYFAFVFGLIIGVWYDLFRLLRALGFNSKRAFILQDIVFMSGSAVMCFLFALVNVNGHFRVFVMIGHMLGLFAYRFSFGMLSGVIFGIAGKAAAVSVNIGRSISGLLTNAAGKIKAKIKKRKSNQVYS